MGLHHVIHALVLEFIVENTCFDLYMDMAIRLRNTTCR